MSPPRQRLLEGLTRLEHADQYHRRLIWVAQIFLFAAAGIGAFWLRFDFRIPRSAWVYLAYALPIWLIAKAAVFRYLLLDRGWWRFFSLPELLRVGAGNLVGSGGGAAAILLLAPRGFPRSVYVLDLLLCFLATIGIRGFLRMIAETATRLRQDVPGKRVLIYGAGTAGLMLMREILGNPSLQYSVCGFVDDHPQKQGLRLQGVRVVSPGDGLTEWAAKLAVEEVLIAIPSATGAEMTRILERCHGARLACKTVPSLAEIMESHSLAKLIRDVDVKDVLGRTPVRLELEQIRAKLEGKAVLVTGAGGSIGSELCRQIARFAPRALIAYEIGETPLFEIQNEMREKFPRLAFEPEIGDIRDIARLSEVFGRHLPAVVYHAAAYKHVPMMERQVFEAIQNNVFGTHNVARIAAACGAEDFVMISSDKAVNPVNVMGASKRLAELVVNSMQDHGANLVSVRFGNVLGSNGSVIPLFKKQIAAGGPVTITHPEMRRYFMTIPEAVQLVLQASTMGSGGEIFVLDMGEPVKIVDLARNLILLSGLRPDEDIQLAFTGLRPGEKLYEEVNLFDESIAPTQHEKIKIFHGRVMPWSEMSAWLERLRRVSDARDTRHLLLLLKELVPEYNPSAHVLEQAFAEHEEHSLSSILGAIA